MYIDTAYLFEGMHDETRKKILETALEESHPAGDFLFHQDDSARNFYILSEGRVRISVGPQGLLAHVASDPLPPNAWVLSKFQKSKSPSWIRSCTRTR
jgi:hypothetical protein